MFGFRYSTVFFYLKCLCFNCTEELCSKAIFCCAGGVVHSKNKTPCLSIKWSLFKAENVFPNNVRKFLLFGCNIKTVDDWKPKVRKPYIRITEKITSPFYDNLSLTHTISHLLPLSPSLWLSPSLPLSLFNMIHNQLVMSWVGIWLWVCYLLSSMQNRTLPEKDC